jgi:hypothetical protein
MEPIAAQRPRRVTFVTNRWQPVYHGLILDQCFEAIEEEEVFCPQT